MAEVHVATKVSHASVKCANLAQRPLIAARTKMAA